MLLAQRGNAIFEFCDISAARVPVFVSKCQFLPQVNLTVILIMYKSFATRKLLCGICLLTGDICDVINQASFPCLMSFFVNQVVRKVSS